MITTESKLEIDENGTKFWRLPNGWFHRTDGPAIEFSDGSVVWYLNGRTHREDGPAAESSCGTKSWYLKGKLHRSDGPAVEYPYGLMFWYLRGEFLFEARP